MNTGPGGNSGPETHNSEPQTSNSEPEFRYADNRAQLTIAIVGSRDYPNMALVRDFVRQLPQGVDIISGGARGVDSVAAHAARHYGHPVTEFMADWNRYGKAAGFIRNQEIVDSAEFLVAFWDGKSRGTEHTIALAKKHHVPHSIFGPDASTTVLEVLGLLAQEDKRRAYAR